MIELKPKSPTDNPYKTHNRKNALATVIEQRSKGNQTTSYFGEESSSYD